jgi:hypothetical protein
MAQFKVLSRHLLGIIEKNHEKPARITGLLGRDLNPGLSEYEAGVTTTWPWLSVRCRWEDNIKVGSLKLDYTGSG